MSRRILIVDKDAIIRKYVIRILEEMGHLTAQAESVSKAIVLIESLPIDLILLELQLPLIHGGVLLAELTRREISVPVLIISSTSDVEAVVQAFHHQAIDFLRKPFRGEQLSAAVIRALAETTHDSEPPLPPS